MNRDFPDGPREWNVGAELAALRGRMDTGFARLEGRLDLLVQSQDQVRADVRDLDGRVAALEARRWPRGTAGMVAAVSGVVSAVVAFAAYLAR